MNRILLPKLDPLFAGKSERAESSKIWLEAMERIGGGKDKVSKWRIPWEVDRFQCRFFSHLFVCILLNSSYCRSDVFRKYEADVPM